MSRLGLSPGELVLVAESPSRLDAIELRFVMSYLACAEQQDHSLNGEQLARFQEARRAPLEAAASFANSSGIFLGPG